MFSKTKNCKTLIIKPHRKPEGTLELKFTQPREILSFKPSNTLGVDPKRMIGLTSLEVSNCIFNKTEEKKQIRTLHRSCW